MNFGARLGWVVPRIRHLTIGSTIGRTTGRTIGTYRAGADSAKTGVPMLRKQGV